MWQKIAAPGGIASNAHLSVAVHDGTTEVLTCVGGWGGGQLYYATLDSPSKATWSGPVTTDSVTHPSWDFFPGQSAIFGKCKTPTSCDAGVHHLGAFPSLAACQAVVNATTSFKVASYTYQHNVRSPAASAHALHIHAPRMHRACTAHAPRMHREHTVRTLPAHCACR